MCLGDYRFKELKTLVWFCLIVDGFTGCSCEIVLGVISIMRDNNMNSLKNGYLIAIILSFFVYFYTYYASDNIITFLMGLPNLEDEIIHEGVS